MASHRSNVDMANMSPKSVAIAAEETSTMPSKLDLQVESDLIVARHPHLVARRIGRQAIDLPELAEAGVLVQGEAIAEAQVKGK